MDIHLINEQLSVSGQITPEDVQGIAEAGVEVLVCNRPDFEEPNQPNFSDIEKEAQSQNLEVFNIPFAGGQMHMEHVEAFAEVLKTGKRVHAYCRTGRRCTGLWDASSQLL